MNRQITSQRAGGPSHQLAGLRDESTAANLEPLLQSLKQFVPLPQEIEREVSCVRERKISRELQPWVDAYSRVGNRNVYLWKWCRQGVEVTTLPCVDEAVRDDLGDTKVLGVMLDVLLDDVADQQGGQAFFESLLQIPYGDHRGSRSQFTEQEQAYAELTARVWEEICRRVEHYSHFNEYAELLQFDYLQLLNAMRYSHLINADPALLNLAEHDLYLPHNMHMMVSATMDLMCSPQFDRLELGRVREAVWTAQCMGRIGNLVTTWQRELKEGDFTSGVFAHALRYGDLTLGEMLTGDCKGIERIIQRGGHELFFLQRWQKCRQDLLSMQSTIHSFDLTELVAGLERLICLHLGSRGDK